MARSKGAARPAEKNHYEQRQVDTTNSRPIQTTMEDFHRQRDNIPEGVETEVDDVELNHGNLYSRQHVFDLGISGDSSDEDNDSDSDGSDDGHESEFSPRHEDQKLAGSSESNSIEDEKSETVLEQNTSARYWGRKKSAYYSGDTGDLELGQDEDDAFVEEEAALEVQKARLGEMEEDDFRLPLENVDGFSPHSDRDGEHNVGPEASELGLKERRAFLRVKTPETLPIAAYVSQISKHFSASTNIALHTLFEDKESTKSIGASTEGQAFVVTKSMIEQTIALNTAMYLLIKSLLAAEDDGEDLQGIDPHPVTEQLNHANELERKFKVHVEGSGSYLEDQITDLAQAASLMIERGGKEFEQQEQGKQPALSSSHVATEQRDTQIAKSRGNKEMAPTFKAEGLGRNVQNEARFGLRQQEIGMHGLSAKGKTARYLDWDELETEGGNSRSFAAAINSIDQRMVGKRKKEAQTPSTETLDLLGDGGLDVADGLRLMQGELSGGSAVEEEVNSIISDKRSRANGKIQDDFQFYSDMAASAKRKKEFKEKTYRVAPRFPASEVEVTGERAIGRTIMKNRGLVAHKAKINRNPRLKKRMQYRKALIRRKGAVREVRAQEGQQYNGEDTGIKSGISRSRKLAL